MKYLSLFSGIGGFELGIQQAYEKIYGTTSNLGLIQSEISVGLNYVHTCPVDPKKTESMIPCCIGFSEIDKFAKQVYLSHFPSHHDYGDIRAINENELPDFDLLVGGFPCQAFSIAGKRKGFEDTRGTLFFEIARILRAKQPRLLFLENVKGLLSHDNGQTFAIIISTLDELGYDLQWQVLNSKNHGVPQNRERVFIIGHLRGTSRPEIFPFGHSDGVSETEYVEIAPSISALTATDYKGPSKQRPNLVVPTIQQLNQPKHSNDRVYGTDGISPTLNTMQGGNRQPFIQVEPRIRRLTPGECLALQGFPRDWCKTVSDSQAYKCAGNAVTVNVIQGIAERLLFPNQ